MASYQKGGWYDNPATGKNQEWNGSSFLAPGQTLNGPLQNSGGSSSGGGSGSPTDDLISSVVDGYQKQLQQYNDRFSEFTTKNPFNFDTVLASETAKVKQRLDPYYNQVLGDYLQGAEVKKSRSLEDERNLLGQLSQTTDRYNQNQKDILKNTLDSIDQGNAVSGLSESGLGARQQGNAAADTEQNLNQYNQTAENTAKQTQIAGQRYRGYDIPLGENMEKRDVNQEETYNTQAQALTQANQAQNQWQFARQEYAGNPAGVNPQNYQQNLYSILGQ